MDTYPSLDIITANNGDIRRCMAFLKSLGQQSLLPDRVVVLLYPAYMNKESVDQWKEAALEMLGERYRDKLEVYWHGNSDYMPGNGIGYDRKWRTGMSRSILVYLIDDDNQFGPDFLKQSVVEYLHHDATYDRLVYSPTILLRDTSEIQSQGITDFLWVFPKYRFDSIPAGEGYQCVKMIGGNSLLAYRSIFGAYIFDEKYVSSYEDVDLTYGMYRSGVTILVSADTHIHHMESKQTPLGSKFLGTDTSAYNRSGARIYFAKKHSSRLERLLYICCGLWIQTAYFIGCVLLYAPWNQKLSRCKCIVSGTTAGLFNKL